MAVSTVFGMNLHSGLESVPYAAFWLVFLGGLLLGMVVKGWVSARPAATDRQPHARRRK